MREESEGYAKLIVELNQININVENIQIVQENVKKLIGHFSLDPNRVLDLILDSFENNIWNNCYLTLLKDNFKEDYISTILGFKLQNYLEMI